MKTIIFFVPHIDDELLVGGGLLLACASSSDWITKVVFATNGDFYSYEAEIRLQEAIKSCKCLGVDESNIIFLGYGDQWVGKHIYNRLDNCESMSGRKDTYALEQHPDFAYDFFKKHNIYNRVNYKSDIEAVIRAYYPEVLVCVDFDSHPDHRALSLLFSEALRSVLSERMDYQPLVLKKLAYENVMLGKKDYYKWPHQVTHNDGNDLKSTPILKWDERIAFNVPYEANTKLLKNNLLYQASKCHKTQDIRFRMDRVINADIVYWRLNTNNLALHAKINVSSGNAEYLNDLKTIDSSDITLQECLFDVGIWIPDEDDLIKTAVLTWENPIKMSHIVIYENPNYGCNIDELVIVIDDKKLIIQDIYHDGSATNINFENSIETSSIEFFIKRGTQNAGITEIEILNEISPVDSWKLPCGLFQNEEITKLKMPDKVSIIFERIMIYIEAAKDKYLGTIYSLQREFPEFKKSRMKCLLRIRFVLKRLRAK